MYEKVFGPTKTPEQIAKLEEKRELLLGRIRNHKTSSYEFPSTETEQTKHETFLKRNENRTLNTSRKFGIHFGTDPNAKAKPRTRKARKTRKSLRKRNLRK